MSRVIGGLKAGQVCGVITQSGRAIEIVPKIEGASDTESRRALVWMLSVAYDLKVSDGEIAQLETQKYDLLELLIVIFVRRLQGAMKGGLQRQYLGHQDELPYIRGTLEISRQLSKRPVAPSRLFCRFDDQSENTPLNRLLKATLVKLLGRAKLQETQRNLLHILDAFGNVKKSVNPLTERILLDRTTGAYNDLIPLARLLLQGHWQNTTSGQSGGTALLFSMNQLFERYVARCAQQMLGSKKVRKQDFRHYALKNKLFRMIPDLVIEHEAQLTIIDTKWKQLDPAGPAKLGVSESDVYQMLAYGHGYSRDGVKPRLVLLYPHTGEFHSDEGIQRRWRVSGSDLPLSIATVDVVSKRRSPEQWKRLFNELISSECQ